MRDIPLQGGPFTWRGEEIMVLCLVQVQPLLGLR